VLLPKALKVVLAVSLLLLSSCASVHYAPVDSEQPISLSETVYGYQTGKIDHHFREEIWVYTLWGLPQVTIGTREGIPADEILSHVLKKQVAPGQGIIRLKLTHTRNLWTWMATVFSLGIFTPTAITLEGDVVNLVPR